MPSERPYEIVPADEGFVRFRSAGESADGEFHCSECGYGIIVQRALPVCPMCAGNSWEQDERRPFPGSATPKGG